MAGRTIAAEPYVALADADPPVCDRGEALVNVHAVSLNRCETAILPPGCDVRDDGNSASLEGWLSSTSSS
jgi:hypothetical protein